MKIKRFWNERWAPVITPVPTKKCDYMISDFGRILSIEKATGNERLLKGSITKTFHKQLNIMLSDNSYFREYIHIFIAKKFIPKTKEDQEFVAHKDQDKGNNIYRNLEWLTRKELVAIQKSRGQFDYANKKNGITGKLTETKVKLLKARLRRGKTKRKVLAKLFGISEMQISRIVRGENWSHIE